MDANRAPLARTVAHRETSRPAHNASPRPESAADASNFTHLNREFDGSTLSSTGQATIACRPEDQIPTTPLHDTERLNVNKNTLCRAGGVHSPTAQSHPIEDAELELLLRSRRLVGCPNCGLTCLYVYGSKYGLSYVLTHHRKHHR